jgi:hypothetical protein
MYPARLTIRTLNFGVADSLATLVGTTSQLRIFDYGRQPLPQSRSESRRTVSEAGAKVHVVPRETHSGASAFAPNSSDQSWAIGSGGRHATGDPLIISLAHSFLRSDRLLRTSRIPTYLLPRMLIEKAITTILKTNAPNV